MNSFPRCVPHAQALAFDNDAWVDVFEGLMLGQVMPDMCAIVLDHLFNVVRVQRRIHLGTPFVLSGGDPGLVVPEPRSQDCGDTLVHALVCETLILNNERCNRYCQIRSRT